MEVTDQELKNYLIRKMGAPKICVLCGEPAEGFGIFEPEDPQRWGAPEGKRRYILYDLCERCRHRPNAIRAIETLLAINVAGGIHV